MKLEFVGMALQQLSPRIMGACYSMLRATRLLMHERQVQSWRARSETAVTLPIMLLRSTLNVEL